MKNAIRNFDCTVGDTQEGIRRERYVAHALRKKNTL